MQSEWERLNQACLDAHDWRERAYRMARLARELAEHHGAPRQPPEYIEQTVYREAVAIEWLYERTPKRDEEETP